MSDLAESQQAQQSGELADGAVAIDDEQLKREQTTAQLNAIVSEIRENQPLTSDLFPICNLVDSYLTDDLGGTEPNFFLQGACYLSQKYKSYRRVRGDGNCYYRALLYALCEGLLKRLKANEAGALEELERLKCLAKESFHAAVKTYGYDEFALETFYEEFLSLLSSLSSYTFLTQNDLHKRLNEEGGTADYCTWYMRVLTACKLKSDPDRFAGFLCFEDGMTGSAGEYVHNPHLSSAENIAEFCLREVEPMGRECTMVQVLALAEIIEVTVAIEYLDGRPFDEERGLVLHRFAEEGGEEKDAAVRNRSSVTLLYRYVAPALLCAVAAIMIALCDVVFSRSLNYHQAISYA